LTKQEAQELGYVYVPMPYTLDRQEVFPYEENLFNPSAFYESMRRGAEIKTASPPPAYFEEFIERIWDADKDIIWVGLSSKMSGVYQFIQQAIKNVQPRYPNRKIYVVDTLAVTAPMHLIAIRIAEKAKTILQAEKLVQYANELIPRVKMYFFPENLQHFRKGGRVSNISAFMGGLFGVRPLMTIKNGELVVLKKIKGKKTIIRTLAEMVEKEIDDCDRLIVVAHSGNIALAVNAATAVKHLYSNLLITDINPTTGAHCGPDAVGICFISKR
jgi:DegV family protein with EDD domain